MNYQLSILVQFYTYSKRVDPFVTSLESIGDVLIKIVRIFVGVLINPLPSENEVRKLKFLKTLKVDLVVEV